MMGDLKSSFKRSKVPDVRQSDQNLVNAVSISGEALESDEEGETDPPIPALRVEHRESETGQEETGSHSVTRLYSSKPKYDRREECQFEETLGGFCPSDVPGVCQRSTQHKSPTP
uniref:Uncharacterized protein n=1 Tax=Magallana gigas TaxID=29159 RepID=K1PYB8_MAGGI